MNESVNQLEALYRETGPDLLAYFQRRPALTAAAEDLLQDTFVRAFKQLERLKSAASPRAYLFGIARHVGLDALRKRQATAEFDEEAVRVEERPNPRLEVMRNAIAALPEAQREVLELKLQHELTYEEIAGVLEIPIGTVRSRLHHAVLALREELNPPQSTKESYENRKS
jgi:RNA polymerase sigma-70 factor (ECF subfamily)